MGAAAGRVPERTCVACRTTRPKADLVRVVRGASGQVAVDPSGTAQGRGAYVCPEGACVERAGGRLGRSLRAGSIDRNGIMVELRELTRQA